MAVKTWIATYDISVDRSRTRVARLLQARGHRILYSVFELSSSDRDVAGIVARSEGLLGAEDHLLLVPICGDCRMWAAGPGLEPSSRTFVVCGP